MPAFGLPHGVTVAGNRGPIRVSTSVELSAFEPGVTRETYRGENRAVALGFLTIAGRATSATYRQEAALASIEAVFRNLTAVVDVVEIDFNAVQREWWTAPVYAALTNSQIVDVEGALRLLQDYAAETPKHTAAEVDAKRAELVVSLGGLPGAALDDLIYNGPTYSALLPVVTFSRTVSKDYKTPFVILDIGKVFYTATMLANVPTNVQYQIAEVTNTIAANTKQTLGWLKTGRRSVTSDGSSQYVQQYMFDAYPSARYTFV